jgi:simple sugar transport system ATP-binding protein
MRVYSEKGLNRNEHHTRVNVTEKTVATPLLALKHVTKKFGGVLALAGVSLEIGHNEVVALIGDNGAGKTTLIKIITGVYKINSGEITFKNQQFTTHSVSQSREMGIETVYQEKALADQQALWRNIFMGREITTFLGFIDVRKQKQITERLLREEMGFTSSVIAVDSDCAGLSGGEKQGIAISRALYFDADLIIMDEPTMGLSLSETEKVLDFVKEIKDKGKSCIFISHNILHIYDVADRFVIMDRGTIAANILKEEISMDELSDKMKILAKTGHI